MTDREHDDLAREATAAGLMVARLAPHRCAVKDGTEYDIQLWAADGVLWAEGTHESASMVREHIRRYADRHPVATSTPDRPDVPL